MAERRKFRMYSYTVISVVVSFILLLPGLSSQSITNPPSLSSLPTLPSSSTGLPNLPNGLPGNPFGQGSYEGEYQPRVSLMDASTDTVWRIELILPNAVSSADVHYLVVDKNSGYDPASQQQDGLQPPSNNLPTSGGSLPNISLPGLPTGPGNQTVNPTQYNYMMTTLAGNQFVTNYVVFSPEDSQLLWYYFTIHPNSTSALSTPWVSFEGYTPTSRAIMAASGSITDVSGGTSPSFSRTGYSWATNVIQSNAFSTPDLTNIYALEMFTTTPSAVTSPTVTYKVNAGVMKQVALSAKNTSVWWTPVILSTGDVMTYNLSFFEAIGGARVSSPLFVYRIPGRYVPQVSDSNNLPSSPTPGVPNGLGLPVLSPPQIGSPTLPNSSFSLPNSSPTLPTFPSVQSVSETNSSNLLQEPNRWPPVAIDGNSTNFPGLPGILPTSNNMPLPPTALPTILGPGPQSPMTPPTSPAGTPPAPPSPPTAGPTLSTTTNDTLDSRLMVFTVTFVPSSSSTNLPGQGGALPNPPSESTGSQPYDIIFSSDWQNVGVQGLNYVILNYQLNDGAQVSMQMSPQSAVPVNIGGPDFGVPTAPSAPGANVNSADNPTIFQQISIFSTFQATFRQIQLAPSDSFYYSFTYQPAFTQAMPVAITSTWYKYNIATNTSSAQNPPSSTGAPVATGPVGPGLSCPMTAFDRNFTLMNAVNNVGIYNLVAYPKALESQNPSTISILSVILHTATATKAQQDTQMSMFADPLSFASSFSLPDFDTMAYSFTYMVVPTGIAAAATFCTSDSYSFVAPSTSGWSPSSGSNPSVYFPSEVTNINTDPKPSGIPNLPVNINPTNAPILPSLNGSNLQMPNAPTSPVNNLPGLPFSTSNVGSANILSTDEVNDTNTIQLLPTIPQNVSFSEDQMIRLFDADPATLLPSPLGGSSDGISLDTFTAAANSVMCFVPCISSSQNTAIMTNCLGSCVQPYMPLGIQVVDITALIDQLNGLFTSQMIQSDNTTIISDGPPSNPDNPMQYVVSQPIPRQFPSADCLSCYQDCETHADATVSLCSSACWSVCMDQVAYNGEYAIIPSSGTSDSSTGGQQPLDQSSSTGNSLDFADSSSTGINGEMERNDMDGFAADTVSITDITSTAPALVNLVSSFLGYTPTATQSGLQSLSMYTQLSRYLSAITALPAQFATSPGTGVHTVSSTLIDLIGEFNTTLNGMPHTPPPSINTFTDNDTVPIVPDQVCSAAGFHTCMESCLTPITEEFRLSLPGTHPLRIYNASYYTSPSCAQSCFEQPCTIQLSVTSNMVNNDTTTDVRNLMRAMELHAVITSLEPRNATDSDDIAAMIDGLPTGPPSLPPFSPPAASVACSQCVSSCPPMSSAYFTCMTNCNEDCFSGLGISTPTSNSTTPPMTLGNLLSSLIPQTVPTTPNDGFESALANTQNILKMGSTMMMTLLNPISSAPPASNNADGTATPLLSISSLPPFDAASYSYPLYQPMAPMQPTAACQNSSSVVTMDTCNAGCMTVPSVSSLGTFALCIAACLNSNCLSADLNQLYGARSFRLLLQSVALNQSLGSGQSTQQLASMVSQADYNLVPLQTDPFATYNLTFASSPSGSPLPTYSYYFPSSICVRCSEYCWSFYESSIRACMTALCRYGCVIPSGVDGSA